MEREPEISYTFRASRADLARILERAHLFPPDTAPLSIREALRRIEHGGGSDVPAAARLTDGTFIPRVYFVEADRVLRNSVPFWSHFVRPRHVSTVLPSPNQIPAPVARDLFRVGETSMSSLEFVVRLKDGTEFACLYSGASDFIEVPKGHAASEIVGVKIGRGLARESRQHLSEPDFVWCVLG